MIATMASIQERNGKFQIRVKNKLLPRPYFFTFDTLAEAKAYAGQAEALLAAGVVPQGMVTARAAVSPLMVEVVDQYLAMSTASAADQELLSWANRDVVGVRVSDLTFPWVEAYVRRLKVEANLGPGTVRKRVGVFSRVLDWHLLRTVHDKSGNPFRMLPVGYSLYTAVDVRLLKPGAVPKTGAARDVQLTERQEAAVRSALAGVKRSDRERPYPTDPELTLLFNLLLDTGLRLREAYRLRIDQLDFANRFIRVEGSKGHRGALKPRVVPLAPMLAAELLAACAGRSGLVFGFWEGTRGAAEKKTTGGLSKRFRTLFDYAGATEITEHDLRHTATCRWVLLKNAQGRWAFSETQLCRIMGWSDTSMLIRYASLRGEDLASAWA